MNLLMLPDSAALLILMGVLAWARTKYRDHSVNQWLIGLCFILLESFAVIFYRQSPVLHRTLHSVALDCYVLAGTAFGWASWHHLYPSRSRVYATVMPAAPLLLLCTAYGAEVQSRGLYVGMASLSLAVGVLFALLPGKMSRRARVVLFAINVSMWGPVVAMSAAMNLRWAIYWGLSWMYLLLAFSFRGRVQRGGIGGVAIVSGFTIWAFCFLLHPLARPLPLYAALLEQVWNMQKFLVILGMLLVLLEDETRRRQAEAMHDPLTGLPNRRLFEDRLALALERANRAGSYCAVFAVDLDQFKEVNDIHGHQRGDQVLQLAARQLALQVRATDTLARCGGDEFSVIVGDIAHAEVCESIANSLRRSVASGRLEGLTEHGVTCSVGYAVYPLDAHDGVALCKAADARMYADKRKESADLPLLRSA